MDDDDPRIYSLSAKFSNSALAASTLRLHNEAHLCDVMDQQDLSGCGRSFTPTARKC